MHFFFHFSSILLIAYWAAKKRPFFSDQGQFFRTFAPGIKASSIHDGRAKLTSHLPQQRQQQQHQHQYLTRSLSVSLSTECCLTRCQWNKTAMLKTTHGKVSPIGWIPSVAAAALFSQLRHNICKRASICPTDILKYAPEWPRFNSSMRKWTSPSLCPKPLSCKNFFFFFAFLSCLFLYSSV